MRLCVLCEIITDFRDIVTYQPMYTLLDESIHILHKITAMHIVKLTFYFFNPTQVVIIIFTSSGMFDISKRFTCYCLVLTLVILWMIFRNHADAEFGQNLEKTGINILFLTSEEFPRWWGDLLIEYNKELSIISTSSEDNLPKVNN